MLVQVKEGLRVMDPVTRKELVTDDDGIANVPDTNYWHRRIRSGDVTVVEDETDDNLA